MKIGSLIKKVFSCMLSFILMISILMIVTIHIVDITLLNQTLMLSLMSKLNFVDTVYNSSIETFEMYIEQSGLDKEVLDDVLTKDMILKDLNGTIRYIYEGVEYDIDSATLKTNLKNNIDDYIKDSDIIMTADLKKNVDIFIDDIGNKYEHNIISKDIAKEGANIFSKVKNIVQRFKNKLLIIPALVIVIIMFINLSNVFKTLTYIGIAVMPLSIVLYAPVFIANKYMDVENINILNDVVSRIIQSMAGSIIYKFSYYSSIMLIVGIALIMLGNLLRKYRGAGSRRHRKNRWDNIV